MRELRNRLGYLTAVGLGYLTLDRAARTLSGGEAQRIHLASALGGRLSGTLYALDEPTVGLHARDSRRLLGVLRNLRDLGNTVIVVEHDPLMIREADYLVELGPGGGRDGGNLVYSRHAGGQAQARRRRTHRAGVADARHRARAAPVQKRSGRAHHPRRRAQPQRHFRLHSARTHGVRDRRSPDRANRPWSKKSCTTTTWHAPARRSARSAACERIDGLEMVERVVHMGQEALARSTRSNPATYLKIYDAIRKLFASTQEARRVGIEPKHFSFNVVAGRCEQCHGMGTVTVEMHFMADLEVKCDACDGRRFQSHVLGIKYRGLNINEVLALTVDDARAFFSRQAQDRQPAATRWPRSALAIFSSDNRLRRSRAERPSGCG